METIILLQGPKTAISLRLTNAMIEQLDLKAQELNLNRTEVIERYLAQALTSSETNTP